MTPPLVLLDLELLDRLGDENLSSPIVKRQEHPVAGATPDEALVLGDG
jgi:hypothetical protein